MFARRRVPKIGTIGLARGEQPGECELGRLHPLLCGKGAHLVGQREVALEVTGLKLRQPAAKVAFRDVGGAAQASGQPSSSERAVGDEADSELVHER